MPSTHTGVGMRLKLLGVLGIVGGLLLATMSVAIAQQNTSVNQQSDTRVSASFEFDDSVDLSIPGTFFPGFDAAGSLVLDPRTVHLNGAGQGTITIVAEALRLEESQTVPSLIAPNPDKPTGSTAEYLGRAVAVSISVNGNDANAVARFNPTMRLSFDLTDAEWAEAANDPDAFVIRTWDANRSMWLTVETSTDPFDMIVTAKSARVGQFALFMEQAPPPIQGGDVSLSSMTLLLIAMAGLALVATGTLLARGIVSRRSR